MDFYKKVVKKMTSKIPSIKGTIFQYTQPLKRPLTIAELVIISLDAAIITTFENGYKWQEPSIESTAKNFEYEQAHVINWSKSFPYSLFINEEIFLEISCMTGLITIATFRYWRERETGEVSDREDFTFNTVEIDENNQDSIDRAKFYIEKFLRSEWKIFFNYTGAKLEELRGKHPYIVAGETHPRTKNKCMGIIEEI